MDGNTVYEHYLLISTQELLVCLNWLFFGFFLAIEFPICAKKKKFNMMNILNVSVRIVERQVDNVM